MRISESLCRIHIGDFSFSERAVSVFIIWMDDFLFCVCLLHFVREHEQLFFIWLDELVENSSELSTSLARGHFWEFLRDCCESSCQNYFSSIIITRNWTNQCAICEFSCVIKGAILIFFILSRILEWIWKWAGKS